MFEDTDFHKFWIFIAINEIINEINFKNKLNTSKLFDKIKLLNAFLHSL